MRLLGTSAGAATEVCCHEEVYCHDGGGRRPRPYRVCDKLTWQRAGAPGCHMPVISRGYRMRMNATAHRSTVPFPARVRLRFPELRGDPFAAGRVAGAIRAIPGVVSADASSATGSLLITYRLTPEDEASFWSALQRMLEAHGLSCVRKAQPSASAVPHSAQQHPYLHQVTERAVDAVIGTLAQRLSFAVLGALL